MKQGIFTLSFIFAVLLTSCSNTKNTTSTAQTSETTPTEATKETAQDMESANQSETIDNERINMVSGNDIIRKTMQTLNSNLSLNENQVNDITNVLKTNFTGSGYSLDERYPATEARKMSKDLVAKSIDSIRSFLDDQQKNTLSKLMNN